MAGAHSTTSRVVVRAADTVDGAIDATRRIFGRPLTSVQLKLKAISAEHAPPQDDDLEYHRRMINFGSGQLPDGVHDQLDRESNPDTLSA